MSMSKRTKSMHQGKSLNTELGLPLKIVSEIQEKYLLEEIMNNHLRGNSL